jgi:hypothetical protein
MDSNKKRNNHDHIQHFCDVSKIINQWIYLVKEWTEIQIKGIEKLFNEIIAENFPYIGNEIDIQVHEAFVTPNTCDQKKTTQCPIMLNCQEHRAKDDYWEIQERTAKLLKRQTYQIIVGLSAKIDSQESIDWYISILETK